jgi:hypothetical protein
VQTNTKFSCGQQQEIASAIYFSSQEEQPDKQQHQRQQQPPPLPATATTDSIPAAITSTLRLAARTARWRARMPAEGCGQALQGPGLYRKQRNQINSMQGINSIRATVKY